MSEKPPVPPAQEPGMSRPPLSSPATSTAGSTSSPTVYSGTRPHDKEERHIHTDAPERPSADPLTRGSDPAMASQYAIYAHEPPPLDYTIKDNGRERVILIWITLLYIEAGVLPLLLFYSLRWKAKLSMTTNLAIITSYVPPASSPRKPRHADRSPFPVSLAPSQASRSLPGNGTFGSARVTTRGARLARDAGEWTSCRCVRDASGVT